MCSEQICSKFEQFHIIVVRYDNFEIYSFYKLRMQNFKLNAFAKVGVCVCFTFVRDEFSIGIKMGAPV